MSLYHHRYTTITGMGLCFQSPLETILKQLHKFDQNIMQFTQVKNNDRIYPSLILKRGTRQGCPLSPSPFVVFTESLAAAIQQNNNIKGIKTANIHYQISISADCTNVFTYFGPISFKFQFPEHCRARHTTIRKYQIPGYQRILQAIRPDMAKSHPFLK